jgi:hypothetical protein
MIPAIDWPQTYVLDRSARLPTSKEGRGVHLYNRELHIKLSDTSRACFDWPEKNAGRSESIQTDGHC